MNTIDQRILIPTPPDVVWDYLGDLTKTPEWQADCKSVSFLTSKRSGSGTRMRIAGDKGQDRVVEITAWYDGLGYQYTFVDGMPFRESTGRIRLQEIPEGTVVQWTFTYDVGGLRFGLGRQIENTMEASLKALWRQVSQSGSAQKIREAKSLMRDAPDYEARAQYKPRHPTTVDIKVGDEAKENATFAGPTQAIPPVPTAPEVSASRLLAEEPPFSEDDTRPRRPVAAEPPPVESRFQRPEPEELVDTTTEPDFLTRPTRTAMPDELFETTAEPDFLDDHARFAPPVEPAADTQPIKPIKLDDVPAASIPDEAKQSANLDTLTMDFDFPPIADEPPVAVSPISAEPVGAEVVHAPETDLAPETPEPNAAAINQPEDALESLALDVTVPAAPTEAPTQAVEPQTPTPPKPAEPSRSRDEISKFDTARMSIWEIFGVERPSDAPPPAPAPAPEPEPEAIKTEQQQPAIELPPVTPEALAAEVTIRHAPEPVQSAAPVEISAPTVHSIRSYDLPADTGGRRGGLRLRMRRKTVKLRFPV